MYKRVILILDNDRSSVSRCTPNTDRREGPHVICSDSNAEGGREMSHSAGTSFGSPRRRHAVVVVISNIAVTSPNHFPEIPEK